MNLQKALGAAAALMISACQLGAADSVQIWTGQDLKDISVKLASENGAKKIAGIPLGGSGNETCAVWRRTVSGEAELHEVKTDLLIVEQGGATLLFGGTIPDARTSGVNEVRGASIHGGRQRTLSPGDIIRIPPGTPHQFLLAAGQTVTYFAIKIDAGRSATMQ